MTLQYINTGTSANAGNGDSIRTAFTKVNNNFNFLNDLILGTGNSFDTSVQQVVEPMFVHDEHVGVSVAYDIINDRIVLTTGELFTATNLNVNNLSVLYTATMFDVIMTGTVQMGFFQGYDDVNIVKYATDGSLNFRIQNTYGPGSSEINLIDYADGSFNIVHQNNGVNSGFYSAGQNYIFDDSGRSINIGRNSDINFYADQDWATYNIPAQVSISNTGSVAIRSTLTLAKNEIIISGNNYNFDGSTIFINGVQISSRTDKLTSGIYTATLTTSGNLILPGDAILAYTSYESPGQPVFNYGATFSTDGPFSGVGSLYFDGNSRIEIQGGSIFNLVTGTYTLEWFQKPTVFDSSTIQSTLILGTGDNPTIQAKNGFFVSTYTGFVLQGNFEVLADYTTEFLNTWNHIAVVKTPASLSVFINGIETINTNSFLFPTPVATNSNITLGSEIIFGESINSYTGYISNLRWDARQVYNGPFVPPTSALTATEFTRLLLNTETLPTALYDNAGTRSAIPQALSIQVDNSSLTINQHGELYLNQNRNFDETRTVGTILQSVTDQENYTQISLHNINSGTTATSDLVLINDAGNLETGYIDIGINSSNYSEGPFGLHEPGSGYLFTKDVDLVVGTQGLGTKLVFHAGGSTVNNSAGELNAFYWRFNRSVQTIVGTAGPLNFTVQNTLNNSAAQAVYQAINNAGQSIHFGINSTNVSANFGNIGPGETFIHNHLTTATLHIGSEGDLVFYSNEINGFSGTPTLTMSRVDRSSTFAGHVMPAADLTYDLGSSSTQWRSLYVGTSTIYIGNIPITVNAANNTLVVGRNPGDAPTTATNLATESYVIDYVAQNGGGGGGAGLPNITVPAESGSTYKGLQVAYGRIYANSNSNELNVNKIVIHKPAATEISIDPTASQDDFEVSGIGNSDILAMFVIYGDVNGAKSLSDLQAFAEEVIDLVILDGGVAGEYNTVDAMKTAFYDNYADLAAAANGLYTNFRFYTSEVPTLNGGVTTVREGTSATFDIINNGNGTYSAGIVSSGTNYLVGHKIKILGTSLTGDENTTTFTADVDYPALDVRRLEDAILVNSTLTSITALLTTGTVLTNIDGLGETLTITGAGVDDTEGGLLYPTTGTVTVSPGTSLGEFTIALGTYAAGATPDNDIIITVVSVTAGGVIDGVSNSGTAAGTSTATTTAVSGTNYLVGSGFTVDDVYKYNDGLNVGNLGTNYVVGDVITLLGSNITNGTTPENDITFTVITVFEGGEVDQYDRTGTVPDVWRTNSIDDGGRDQYDTANYISTNLAEEIAYNSGNTIADGTAAFGTGSSYSFVYNTGTFGLFVTGTNVTLIKTSGDSGADGSSITDAGHIYGPNTTTSTYDSAVTHLNIVGDPYAGPVIAFVKTDNGSEVDILIPDDGEGAGVGITRGGQQGIYNPYREEGWSSNVSPDGTLWNIDGWSDFSNIEERTYTNLYAAFGNGLGNKIVNTECVMYLPDNGKYYAVKFSSWTQGAAGGGFAYTRRELDLANLQEGIRFPDGTRLKSAEGVGRVKLVSSGGRRIEEVAGSKTVSFTQSNSQLSVAASRTVSGENIIWFDSTTTTIDEIIVDPSSYGITNLDSLQFSLDDINWYKFQEGNISNDGDEVGAAVDVIFGPDLSYNQGDTIYFRYKVGGEPVVWWDKNELPGGAVNFRGAVIDYHARTIDSTVIGTIHIVDDGDEEHITHIEVMSGNTSGDNEQFWIVSEDGGEGTISYRRFDSSDGRVVKIQWTAKVFYGSET
jgi:hypothetical protein